MASSELSSTSVLKRAWRVSHELPDEHKVAFFDEAQSELVVVNSLGGAIWQLLDGELSVAELSELLATEVDGAPARDEVEREVIAYLRVLVERKAVEIVTAV